MAHKNKTQKCPVDTTCQNESCLLRWLKSRLGFQPALNKTLCPTPQPLIHRRLKQRQITKINKTMLSSPIPIPPSAPHRFSTQSLQYQNGKANKYSILTVNKLGRPVLESSTRISNFMLPLILNTNLIKRKSKIHYPQDAIWDRLDW